MKTSAELKYMARRALRGNYGNAAGGLLLTYLIGILFLIPFFVVIFIAGLLLDSDSSNVALFIMILLTLAMMLVYLGASLILMTGYARLCYQIATGKDSEMGDLLFAVRNHFSRFLGLVVLLILCGVLSMLPGFLVTSLSFWGGHLNAGFLLGYLLAFIIPIAVLCRYVFALFIMVEEPETGVLNAMRLSRELMKGNVWRLIRLEFSFFGMYVLGYITMGIGYLWITPYLLCTNILFYQMIKEEKNPPVYKSVEEEIMEARF